MKDQSKKNRRPYYVLIIEDNPHHAELLTEVLDKHFAPVVIHTVDTINDGFDFVRRSSYDILLAGAIIGDISITRSIPKLSKAASGIPMIIISGRGDERLAAEIIKRGASEYLSKTKETLDLLPQLLSKYLTHKRKSPRKKTADSPARKASVGDDSPSPTSIIREVDKLTQQALTIIGPKRRKQAAKAQSNKQIKELLGQINRLREMAEKFREK